MASILQVQLLNLSRVTDTQDSYRYRCIPHNNKLLLLLLPLDHSSMQKVENHHQNASGLEICLELKLSRVCWLHSLVEDQGSFISLNVAAQRRGCHVVVIGMSQYRNWDDE